MDTSITARRTVGVYPLSIATSLAIEGILGVHPDRPTGKNVLTKYTVVWANIRTIYRNLFNALTKEDTASVLPNELAEALLHELEQFENVIATESKHKVRVVYYHSEYEGLERIYKHALLRKDSTPTQEMYTVLEQATLQTVLPHLGNKVHHFKLKITTPVQEKVLLFTHYPIDLFTRTIANKSLWESHTGSVKERYQWYTKYYNGRDLTMIPFREDFIQIFGDSQTFRPMAPGIKKEVIEMAVQNNWSQVTTTEKIRYSLSKMQNTQTRDLIHSLMSEAH